MNLEKYRREIKNRVSVYQALAYCRRPRICHHWQCAFEG